MTNTISDQVAFWNGPGGERWARHQEELDRSLEPLGRFALDRAAARPGEHVVDVGCGCGATSLSLASAVGERGSVLGVDLSAPMVARAKERAASAGVRNATFALGDATTHPFESNADLVFSRFGVMFFPDPVAAFKNLRGALRAGGRMAFLCWAAPGDNPWMHVPVAAASSIVTPPPPPAPDDPGPFALANRDRVSGILEQARFVDVRIEAFASEYCFGPDLDAAAAFAVETGPAARLLGDVDDATRARARVAVREALTPYLGPRGVTLATSTWLVSARRE